MKILITGAAGFIGMHALKTFSEQYVVVGLDNINDYYDTQLKYDRLTNCGIERDSITYNTKVAGNTNISFIELDLQDAGNLNALFAREKFDIVVHLAAQAGVRYSITNPRDYIDNNIIGFFNVLEACRNFPVKHLIYASSSSVYGNSSTTPFTESQDTSQPVSFYAATKKSNEVMAHAYAHLYQIPITGLRFFTVYGPWGRPDMAPMLFAHAGIVGKPIKVFNNGNQQRDFTFITDIINGIQKVIECAPATKNYYKIYNIGRGNPIQLLAFIKAIEHSLGKTLQLQFMEAQPGDVENTFASTEELENLGYKPAVEVSDGVEKFISWFKWYYKHA
jgi:UDP-glucuronate 4-epimerase